jgi:hypothetical protein
VLKDTAGAELLLKIASTSVDEMGEDGGEGENGIVDPTAPDNGSVPALCRD